MKEAKKKVQITDQICRMAQLMRKGGANQVQVAGMLGINSSTVSRIEAAGFDKATYDEQRKARREKEEERKRAAEKPAVELVYDPSILEEYKKEQEAKKAEVQLPGQIEMQLDPEKEILDQKPEMSDQVKLMRFQAAQVDKIIMRLNQLNDTMNMVLRAVRKE